MKVSSESAPDCFDWFCSVSPENSERFSVAVVAAHPDDETIGAAARLKKIRRVSVLFITDGAPRDRRDALAAGFATAQQYATTRYNEALSALSCAGITPQQVSSLGIPDQAAARSLVSVSRSLAAHWSHSLPDIVLTHAYEGGHPDHDAAAFCAHAASHLFSPGHLTRPAIIEFTSYHATADGMVTGQFLPGDSLIETIRLSSEEQDLKRQMFARYATQTEVLAQFSTSTESFRLAPRYEFTRLPETPIHYDRFDWGLRSCEWTQLVAAALHQLKMRELPLSIG
jgi:LmbE family N-acetylglucosaminyl deacetylase